VDAGAAIDAAVDAPPLGYLINCAYPTFLDGAAPPELSRRLIGFQANASALDQAALDGACALRAEPVAEWGGAMLRLRRELGLKLLGGCCGTGPAHLRYLVSHRREMP
ncbi:MAG: homocysteine S-methyltransferase family protein, partial [Gammaproteobacteria bacterium]|nr:homocysteine S-methyltransferase family protein [Gammaproteobacteria bacterium]